ncbi:MAG: hypothetical protein KatS3mg076_3129 [Candidatus Binatia bacterium]|nr:MAG: hypothetical protein KatS3mg076_3129 [Candidatus Binatia bacterium]
MAKVYDALKRVEEERRRQVSRTVEPPPEPEETMPMSVWKRWPVFWTQRLRERSTVERSLDVLAQGLGDIQERLDRIERSFGARPEMAPSALETLDARVSVFERTYGPLLSRQLERVEKRLAALLLLATAAVLLAAADLCLLFLR